MQLEEQLFYAAVLSNCWCVCLFVCVCLEGRTCRRGGGGGGGMHLGSSWRWQLSRAMRLALRWCRLCRLQRGCRRWGAKPRTGGRLWQLWSYGKVLLRSLYFNSLSNSDTLLDCAFEPVYWIVDNVTRWFGVVRRCDCSARCASPPQSLFFSLLLFFFSPPPLSGLCHSGHTAHDLGGGRSLLVRLTHNPQHLPRVLGGVAPLLRPLAPRHGGLPLLQGHYHPPRTPTKGITALFLQVSTDPL